MKRNFKETAAKLLSTFSTSEDSSFIVEVCKYFEIYPYLEGLIKDSGLKVINIDTGTGYSFLSEQEGNDARKVLFLEIIETALEVFEYCQASAIERENTKLAILSILFYQKDKQLFYDIHSSLEEHKRIKESTLSLLEKVLASRVNIKTSTKNKRLFPLDIAEEAIRIRFLSLHNEATRQAFILHYWCSYEQAFIAKHRQEHYGRGSPDPAWVYLNFRNWFMSGNWTTRWSKNKAIALNWPAVTKQSFQIFSKTSEEFSEESLKHYYQPTKKDFYHG